MTKQKSCLINIQNKTTVLPVTNQSYWCPSQRCLNG